MNNNILFPTPTIHQKAWGHEEWITNTPLYCLKILHFNLNSKFSMHFHIKKDETWTVDSGKFIFRWINTSNAQQHETIIEKGKIIHIPPGMPHQLECIEEGRIIEVSTQHFEDDSYRIFPGDSQNKL